MFILRSNNNIVIAAANTGKERANNTAVIKILHTKRGAFIILKFLSFIITIVVIKLMAPMIEETPARCKEKIVNSAAPILVLKVLIELGGYIVHVIGIPNLEYEAISNIIIEGVINQNLILFIRGKAISGAEIIKGTNQFPKPPIMIGITKKKIIKKACSVTILMYILDQCKGKCSVSNIAFRIIIL